ncbi:hypothetical protein P5X59_12280 [Staphylococcus cohnii]|uniref:Uncharacterized protein n=1 Tax=Staphylococcus cohnii TaxID=29382 RepID=A0ABT6J2Z7_9STAP|nr:hypothetical protein [Staphylococcus cohnii]MDH5140528.1 hypothetical protein [Staphylococcus cohnii]MDH5159054.1 hypothetical protein [Staphylococcus cohnii]MDH5170112.1 hypothetical protein [Staphylococcus cohnii]
MENISKETFIDWVDLMIGLTENEKEELLKMDVRKVKFKYKMALTEKNRGDNGSRCYILLRTLIHSQMLVQNNIN